MKNNPIQVIMEVCQCISEREEVKLYLGNIITYICYTLDNNPSKTNIQHLQLDIPTLQTRTSEITDMIWVG